MVLKVHGITRFDERSTAEQLPQGFTYCKTLHIAPDILWREGSWGLNKPANGIIGGYIADSQKL